jgi:hypothetical protein
MATRPLRRLRDTPCVIVEQAYTALAARLGIFSFLLAAPARLQSSTLGSLHSAVANTAGASSCRCASAWSLRGACGAMPGTSRLLKEGSRQAVHVPRHFAPTALQQPAVWLRVDVPLVACLARTGTVATVPVALRDKSKLEVPHMAPFAACVAQQHHPTDLPGCVGLICHAESCVCVWVWVGVHVLYMGVGGCICIANGCGWVYMHCKWVWVGVYALQMGVGGCICTANGCGWVYMHCKWVWVGVYALQMGVKSTAPVPPQPRHMQGTPPTPRVARASAADFPCMRTSSQAPNSAADGQSALSLHLSQWQGINLVRIVLEVQQSAVLLPCGQKGEFGCSTRGAQAVLTRMKP